MPVVPDSVLDLLLGSSCVGCGRAGRLLCPECMGELPREARPAWPSPTPPGLVAPWAVADYDGLPRDLVLGLKERRLLALAAPLGVMLAGAVRAAAAVGGPVVLVPVPSRPVSVRARGHDSTRSIVVRAAADLRAGGADVLVARLLRTRPGLADQAGLDHVARAANLAESMTCPGAGLRRLARAAPVASVVICDDVLTTGSTAREAQRALQAVGLRVVGVAAVAATRRRTPPPPTREAFH